MDDGAVDERSSTEETLEVEGSDLLSCVRDLVREGDVCRLILESSDGQTLLEVPLSTGLGIGGVVTLLAPVGSALAALGAALAKVRVRVVRLRKGGKEDAA